MRTLVWFRGKDLRVSDHAPLVDACRDGEVVPVFVLDPYFFAPERARAYPHRMQFLLESLDSLEKNIEKLGSRLCYLEGKSAKVIPAAALAARADRVVAHRWVEPFARERDRRVADALGDRFALYEGATLVPPGTIRTGGGTPFSVYTPFSRVARRAVSSAKPLAAPRSLPALPDDVPLPDARPPTLEALGIRRNEQVLPGGERAARARLERFVERGIDGYEHARDRMGEAGTSRLSADLKFGTLSPRTVWHSIASSSASKADKDKFTSELLWREFTHHTLHDRPAVLDEPFRSDFTGFPWRDDPAGLSAWKEGRTGYPVVDAAARQLLAEGYVHNRARMVAASFLTKHLAISYREGEAHYLSFLTDGDWAPNNAGWQWTAGCGCDAQPYFRVFNPVTQGEKFDAGGAYVRRWVPELAKLPDKWIHHPWEAPPDVLAAAGVRLGESYPRPIGDHATARSRFLALAKSHLGR